MDLLSLPNRMSDLQVLLQGLDWHRVGREVEAELQTRLAIVGPVNSGKSTLFNYLQGRRLSATSAVPGTTQGVVEHPLGPLYLVDTPGFGEVWGVDRAATALEAARNADVIVLLLDAVAGVRQSDQALLEELQALRRPLIVALNKVDLIKKDLPWVLENAEQVLGLRPLPLSARTGEGVIDRLVPAIVDAQPALAVALARALPALRTQMARRLIHRTAWFNALIGLQPVPGLSVPLLLVSQTRLVLRMAAIYGESMSVSHARELLTAAAGGLLSRYLSIELAKLVPGLGWLVSAAISGISTWALGEAMRRYFEAGRDLQPRALRPLYQNLRKLAPRRLLKRPQIEEQEASIET
ncbi:MAG: GTPase [Anaerolineae bacterium]